MTIGIAIGALGVIALVVGFAWWLASWARSESADARAQEVVATGLRRDVSDRDVVISQIGRERDAALAAHKKGTEVLANAIKKMAERSTPAELVDDLNNELSALSSMSFVPTTPTGAGAEDREGLRAVHDRPGDPAGADDSAAG